MAVDGWSSPTNEPVIGISITCKSRTSLIDTIDTTGHHHTIPYMTETTLNGIQKAEETFDVKVRHVVTDGAANMTGMREAIRSQRDDVIAYHCQPHLLNLLAKDIKQAQTETINKVLSVVKFFRNKHDASASLKAANISRPPVPAETRWNTMSDTLEYYCVNWAVLVELISDLQGTNGVERKFLENIQIRNAACDLRDIFSAVSKALNTLQRDGATIGQAVEVWLDLLHTIDGLQNPEIREFAKKRCHEMLKDHCFLAANLLDPRYLGERLNPAQIRNAIKFIKSINPDVEQSLTQFVAKTSPYDMDSLGKNIEPGVWWVAGKRIGFDMHLCNVALGLVTGVANSAGLERQFSTMRITYGTLRTRLSVEKAGKLAFCFRSLNG